MSEIDGFREEDNWQMPPKFYVVSIKKFLALFIFTNGLYLFYWFYTNWKMYKLVTHEKVLPMAYTVFMYFYIYPLLSRINKEYRDDVSHGKWSPLLYTVLLTTLLVAWQIINRIPGGSEYEKYIVSLCSAILIPIAIVCIRIQKFINVSCGDPDGISNERLSVSNWFWIFIGSVLWGLIIFGQAVVS